MTNFYLGLVIEISVTTPAKLNKKIVLTKHLITNFLQILNFVIIDGYEDDAI